MTPVIGDILESTVGKVVGRLADKFFPSSMSEKEKADFQNEAGKLMMEEYKAALGDIHGARELAGKENDAAPVWTKVLTVTHRPIWSFIMLAVFIWTIIAPYLKFPLIPLTDIHKEIMQTVIIFYFGGRSIEKITDSVWGK
ncbi:hypothetical protein EPN18_09980 [bacterium]|nr:MAG: hypothetical protein EPN18_09980 [bacterium]